MRGKSENSASAPRAVRCPRCGAASLYAPENPYRPFCSQRCQQMDLGDWASERFRLAATPPEDEGDDMSLQG